MVPVSLKPEIRCTYYTAYVISGYVGKQESASCEKWTAKKRVEDLLTKPPAFLKIFSTVVSSMLLTNDKQINRHQKRHHFWPTARPMAHDPSSPPQNW